MISSLCEQLLQVESDFERLSILDSVDAVSRFFSKYPFLRTFLAGLSVECESAFKQLIAIGQADLLFEGVNESNVQVDSLRQLLEHLVAMDRFYREMGGIVGYQLKIKQLLQVELTSPQTAQYHSPDFLDITTENSFVQEAVSWGIDRMAELAEIYPLGGAADRLHLVDEATGIELPAAKLPFAGKTLLERLVSDLQAREALYFERTGHQLITPIAIMTSHEKNNHAHVLSICESLKWFGRPKESIRFFTQPLVPTVDSSGNWCVLAPLKPLFKPGGHGVIWKLARDGGIFTWLKHLGRTKALIRQINNPLAGLDYGLLAFTGIGTQKKMVFGFASCPRLLQAAEGVNVLIEQENQIVLSNIEYCDFAKFGVEDRPLKEGEPYSRFSSNTNILFVDLEAIEQAVASCPFPGLLINLKRGSFTTEKGEKKEAVIGRLESTMQNIADVFKEEKTSKLKTEKTFVTYNHRHKTISTAKKAFLSDRPLQETPENCFYDLLQANRELLSQCQISLPPARDLQEYLEKGPDSLFLYHPSLGPLYSIIREKIQGGSLGLGSELLVEMKQFAARHLFLQGSLQVIAEDPFSSSSCIFENVKIENQGIDWSVSRPFWKMEPHRLETVKILFKGRGCFIARNVSLKGSQIYVIEDGEVVEVK